jgi:formylglycine-generating enzyme required for sulfatase activity
VFSAALVLVTLLTGWRRRAADELVPPLDAIEDPNLRAVLAKALALAPAERYANGGELAVALGDTTRPAVPTSPPFRHLASFTEADRDRLYGRDREITTLVEHVLFRRAVVYTAPTGTGKTSLLRAGLVPRLDALGVSCVYVACHGREPPDLARAIWSEGATAVAAASARIASEHKRLVIVVDQVEAALASREFVAELCALQGSELELGLVLSVREDVLASLLTKLDAQTNVLRLGPLAPEGAREAIVGPLIERRVTIEEPLLAALLADLERAASLIAAEMRWPAEHAVYPPHLQLACSALFDQLEPGEEVLTLRHYEKLGGLDEIVRDYLDRVLETELPSELVATARLVLLALVEADRSRAVRTDTELAEQLPANAPVAAVLEALRARGIVVPLRSVSGQPAWELVHDSLVPRVLAWSDRQDLARQRALEIVRHHLRGSSAHPSLLTAAELREVRPHAAAIAELDQEWTRRGPSTWTPLRIVEHSRRDRRLRIAALTLSTVIILGAAAFLALRWFSERDLRHRQELLSKGDIGTFVLEIEMFDWDPKTRTPISVAVPAGLDWELREPSVDDELVAGNARIQIEREELAPGSSTRRWHVEAHGGKAILSVFGRGRCAPSIVPLARLPGYATRDAAPTLVVRVPACAATAANTIVVPAGPYISGGFGDPPIQLSDDVDGSDIAPEKEIDLREFSIDRTEVSNAEYRMFAAPTNATSLLTPVYPPSKPMMLANNPDYPVVSINWHQARAYCRYLGKDLPSDHEWEKSLRGGRTLGDKPNPLPRRLSPWGTFDVTPANLKASNSHALPVDATPNDVSPYGVLNLAGNVEEFTRSLQAGTRTYYIARGCSWDICDAKNMTSILAVANSREDIFKAYDLGFRCVLEGHPSND